jgi:hypothetical protein
MNDLKYSIENYHKPRLSTLAEHILGETNLEYDFFSPPTFETYMIQIKIPSIPIICINYIPIPLDDETPFLFLQLHAVVAEDIDISNKELLSYLNFANNNTVVSSFLADDGNVNLRAIITDNPTKDLDITNIIYSLKLASNNLRGHLELIQMLGKGEITAEEAIRRNGSI